MLNRLNCNDARQYRQVDCPVWKKEGSCANNVTVQQLCPLSCNACNWSRIEGTCTTHAQQALDSLVTLPFYVAVLQASPVINASTTPSACLASATSKPGSVSTTALAVPVPPTARARTLTRLTHLCATGDACGVDSQCLSGSCSNFACTGTGHHSARELSNPVLTLTTCFPLPSAAAPVERHPSNWLPSGNRGKMALVE